MTWWRVSIGAEFACRRRLWSPSCHKESRMSEAWYNPPSYAAPTYASSSHREQILAVVGGLRRASGFLGLKQKACALVLTDQRIIFAGMSNERMKQLLYQARDAAKQEGKGLIGRYMAQAQAVSGYQQRYWQMAPEYILVEEVDNFAIPRADVKKVKLKRGIADDSGTRTEDKLIIHTTREKLKFYVGGPLASVREAFRAAGYSA